MRRRCARAPASRSSMASPLLNSPGTIDADYRGEIGVILINLGERAFTIARGDRIAQLVVAPVARLAWKETEVLPRTARAGARLRFHGAEMTEPHRQPARTLRPPCHPRRSRRGGAGAAFGKPRAGGGRGRPRLAPAALSRRRRRRHARHHRRRCGRALQPSAPGHSHHREPRSAQGRQVLPPPSRPSIPR